MKYIKIKTKLPNKNDVELTKQLLEVESRSMHGQLPVVWSRAKDCQVFDRHGNVFLDFTSGICVTNIGHGHEDILKTLREFIHRPLLFTYTFPSEIRYKFIKKLTETVGLDKAFLVSSGTEATEAAVKLMRLHGMSIHPDKKVIICFRDSMHGRTAIAQRLKGTDVEWTGDDTKIVHLPWPKDDNARFGDDLVRAYSGSLSNICGAIIESYQGWSASFLPPRYIKELVENIRAFSGLICFDDVQGGIGRTGKNFGYQHYNIEPDLVCLGKGLSGSVPLAAVVGKKEIMDIPPIGAMSSTHSANPLACATGLVVLNHINALTHNAQRKEEVIKTLDMKIQGKGLVWAIITKDTATADKIVWECFKKGLLVIWTHRNSIKIAPPLTIKTQALLEGFKILKEVINDTSCGNCR